MLINEVIKDLNKQNNIIEKANNKIEIIEERLGKKFIKVLSNQIKELLKHNFEKEYYIDNDIYCKVEFDRDKQTLDYIKLYTYIEPRNKKRNAWNSDSFGIQFYLFFSTNKLNFDVNKLDNYIYKFRKDIDNKRTFYIDIQEKTIGQKVIDNI